MGNEKGLMLSLDTLKFLDQSEYKYTMYQWHAYKIKIKKMLTMSEFVDTVRAIIDNAVDEDGNIVPELVDFSIRVNIVFSYCIVQIPEDVNELYYILYASDLYDFVCSKINHRQVDAIKSCVLH